MTQQDLPEILIAEDIQNYLRIGRNSVYQLAANPTFPAIRLGEKGKLIRVHKEAFLRWIEQQGVDKN